LTVSSISGISIFPFHMTYMLGSVVCRELEATNNSPIFIEAS
jgi:hypothetical protein